MVSFGNELSASCHCQTAWFSNQQSQLDLMLETYFFPKFYNAFSITKITIFGLTNEDFFFLDYNLAFMNLALAVMLASALLVLIMEFKAVSRGTTALQASNERNANTINAALDSIILIDLGGTIIDFNPAAIRTFGYSRNLAMGAKLSDLIVPARRAKLYHFGLARLGSLSRERFSSTHRFVVEAQDSEGKEFPVEVSLGRISGPAEPIIIVFIRDISDRLESEKALRQARDEALEGVRAKSQFLAVMSHEMRTPLNGVMALLDLLSASNLTKRQKKFVKTATISGEILKQHVDDVLDITRLQAGKFDYFPQTFNFVDLLEEVQSMNFATARARRNEIRLDFVMPSPYFISDRKRIHQILTNLVGNAVKFTENGTIIISAKFVEAKADLVVIEVSVSDTGIGIPFGQHKNIFDDFVTLDSSHHRSASGSGLGLSICRDLLRALNGEIGVKSEPGKGSMFWFRIPLKAAFDKSNMTQFKTDFKSVKAFKRSLKVLLVEDNEINRFVAKEMLMSENCKVTHAVDGLEGYKLAKKYKYDLILMDMSMPKMNGWDLTRKIRQTECVRSHSAAIYALTAHAFIEEHGTLEELGFQGLLIKPLRQKKISDVLAVVRNPDLTLYFDSDRNRYSKSAYIQNIDSVVIDELKELLTTEDFQNQIRLYLNELMTIFSVLSSKLQTNNFDELAKCCHFYSGSAALFGAEALRSKLLEMERNAKTKSRERLLNSLAQIDAIARNTSDELHDLMPRLRAVA